MQSDLACCYVASLPHQASARFLSRSTAFLATHGRTVEWHGCNARRFNPARAIGNRDWFEKTGTGEIAVMTMKAVDLGPAEIGVLEVAVDGLGAGERSAGKG